MNYSNFSPLLIGFDQLFNRLDNFKNLTTINGEHAYPPFNIVKTDENKYVIELAIAGFLKSDLELTLEDNVLTISGKTTSPYDTYMHQGIARRAFKRSFSLADTIEIQNAELMNGMLRIWLENVIPEHKKPRKIDIVDQELKKIA